MRRVIYLATGVVALDLAIISGLWVDLKTHDGGCDVDARGLVVRHGDRWETVSPPTEDTGLKPCRATRVSELHILPSGG